MPQFPTAFPTNSSNQVAASIGPKRGRSLYCKPLPTLALLCAAVFVSSALFVTDCQERFSAQDMLDVFLRSKSNKCEEPCKPNGAEALPKGIVSSTSDLEMRPLWGSPIQKKSNTSLLAIAVGKKQKENVDRIVRKFLVSNFIVMLFHYDGNVDDWRDLEWSAHALHVAAANQTKWWFAKRFLHPDIVAEYSYIFLWDEDLGVENFNVQRYLCIIRKEGLEISQPAIDPDKSEIHHKITARQKGALVHRRFNGILPITGRKCDENSTEPPCTGWVEIMAPVFSAAAWRCTWYMIQNDLVHAWGLDYQIGYCAQGERTQKVGVVDSDYVIHYGIPTLGGTTQNKVNSTSSVPDIRNAVMKQSSIDLGRFKIRWEAAVKNDHSWTDSFQQPKKHNS